MIHFNDTNFTFSHMGMFITDKEWIHPKCIQETYQLIYVISGNVHIFENGNYYDLKHGNLLLLLPNQTHYGYVKSTGITSFYWIHFKCDDLSKFENLPSYLNKFDNVTLFKELLHYSHQPNCPAFVTDFICAHILSEMCMKGSAQNEAQSKIASEIFEWTRINADASLNVSSVAKHFRYNPEHISRLMKKYYGDGMKGIINNFIIGRAKDLICNSNYSIKEIAYFLKFTDVNSFIKFYKYHEKISPSKFRNIYTNTIMNNK